MLVKQGEKQVFSGLDGLRGVAAVFVAMRHTSFFHNLGIHGGYLAVDLFFVLSGFVIAHAYEARLAQGLSAKRFLALRYIRLWPVYALGAVLGLIAAWAQALPGRDNMTAIQVAHTAPFALLMLPGPHIKAMLYPVNSVAWSLALELLVNLAYALLWKPLRDPRVLGGVLFVSALWLIGSTVWFGKLDVGFQWADAAGGLPRVAFSFSAGLALHRLYRAGPWRSPLPAWAPLLLLPPMLYPRLDEIVWPLACVLVLFPALVSLAAASEPKTGAARVFAWLGAVSYPLYALHKPAGELLTLWVRHISPHSIRAPWIGVVFLALLAAVSIPLERLYDRPLRRLLTGLLDGAIGLTAGRAKPPTIAADGLVRDTSA
ncbi:MAG TPA: acyltransferase [Caulobacteraceae bacterium]|nr:acyltransferase [Caulobacteraceae bacterium]